MVYGIVFLVVGIVMAVLLPIAFAEAGSFEGFFSSMCFGAVIAIIGGILAFIGFIKWLLERSGPPPPPAYYYPPPNYPPPQYAPPPPGYDRYPPQPPPPYP